MQIYKVNDVFLEDEGIIVKKETADRNKNEHRHEFIELVFISRGGGEEIVDGISYGVNYGDLLFINFGATHAFSMSDMDFIEVFLRPEFLSEGLINSENIFDVFALSQFSTIPGDFGRDCVVSFEGDELKMIASLFESMLHEYTQKKPGYKTALYGYTQILFTMLIRKLKENDEEKSTATKNIENYVSRHLNDRITLADIAKDCFYNPSYFSRKFKSLFGKNLGDYLKDKRLERAAQLLCESDLPIGKIALEVGFSDKTKFYKLFRDKFKITPAEYKRCKKSILKK